MIRTIAFAAAMICAAVLSSEPLAAQEPDSLGPGGLIPATTAMETAWDIPKNPLTDTTLGSSPLAVEIRRGFEIFLDPAGKAAKYTGNALTCANCHLNAGQRERALPLVATAAAFPEYNRRQGRIISLEDRIVGCFLRSLNATGPRRPASRTEAALLPSPASPEVLAISAYLTWLSHGYPLGKEIAWRGRNVIPRDRILPLASLDAGKGKALYLERCSTCHGDGGQGVDIGDKRPGPLWGPRSWNDGAGAARVYTLAGMIRHDMPYLDPGSLTDEEAQQIAFFIDSQPRPVFPYKAKDYLTDEIPVDALYYAKPRQK